MYDIYNWVYVVNDAINQKFVLASMSKMNNYSNPFKPGKVGVVWELTMDHFSLYSWGPTRKMIERVAGEAIASTEHTGSATLLSKIVLNHTYEHMVLLSVNWCCIAADWSILNFACRCYQQMTWSRTYILGL